MLGQDGGMVNDGAMFGTVDDIHGDKLRAEREYIELSTKRLVFLKHLWQCKWK